MNISIDNILLDLFGLIFLTIILFLFSQSFKEANRFKPAVPQKRSLHISFFRGLGMIGIIIIHIDSYFRYFHDDAFTKLTLLLSNLSRFSVPIFIITSSSLLSWKGWKTFFFSRALPLLLPYCLASLFGMIIKSRPESFELGIYLLLVGGVFEPYYFIPLLFQFYFFYYLIKDFENKFSLNLLLLFCSLMFQVFSSNTNLFYKISDEFSRIFFGNFVFFFFFGLVFKEPIKFDSLKFLTRISKLQIINFLFLSCFWAFIFFLSYFYEFQLPNNTIYYPIGFLLLLYLCFSFFYKHFRKFLEHISEIGNRSFAIFLLHPIIMHFLHSLDPYLLGNKFLSYLFILFVNIYVPFSLSVLYESSYKKIRSLL